MENLTLNKMQSVFMFFFFIQLSQISVDVTEVEFGSQVLGETRKRIINVTNNGALGTLFVFRKITGTHPFSSHLLLHVKLIIC